MQDISRLSSQVPGPGKVGLVGGGGGNFYIAMKISPPTRRPGENFFATAPPPPTTSAGRCFRHRLPEKTPLTCYRKIDFLTELSVGPISKFYNIKGKKMNVINFTKKARTNAYPKINDVRPESVAEVVPRTHTSITVSASDAACFSTREIESLDFAYEVLCLASDETVVQELKLFFPDGLWDCIEEPTSFGRLVYRASKIGLLPLIWEGRGPDNHQRYRLDESQRPFRKPSAIRAAHINNQ
jgi:hypothetical protein